MIDDGSSRSESDNEVNITYIQIQRDITLLLDYIEQLTDNRLLVQFADTRANAAENPPSTNTPVDFVRNPLSMSTPPCANYADFLNRLASINRVGLVKDEPFSSRDGDPKLDDISFLRWSRNFLATIAAPATKQSIRTTTEFLEVRGRYTPLRNLISSWRTSGASKRVAGSDQLRRLKLPRSVHRLELGLIVITLLVVIISGYAMVGKYISDQRADALNNLLSTVHDVDADSVLIPRTSGDGNNVQIHDNIADLCANYGGNHEGDHSVVVSGASDTGIDRTAAQVATLQLVQDCRKLQLALSRLVGETIRMRSWQTVFIGGPNGSVSEGISTVLAPLVGWSPGVVSQVSQIFTPEFCQKASGAFQVEPKKCAEAVRGLVADTGSTSSSILGWIALFVVPSLYSLVGAGAATMLELRRKVNTWTLILSDRNLIAYNMILGSAFGAIIGMFSRSFGSETSIGPAAIALLAGFNVPGVFSFLDQLSKQVFRLNETPHTTK
jgi:hypothetical protein